ncbi:Extracellular membrane protein CFEM domain-containing protein [Pleurotus pulmonarius]
MITVATPQSASHHPFLRSLSPPPFGKQQQIMFTAKFFLSFALVVCLAGRALAAFNITVGTTELATKDIIAPSTAIPGLCSQNCTVAQNMLIGCADDASCLCGTDTLGNLTQCEQCIFTELIRENKPMADFRAGSNVLLGAYRTACNASTKTAPPADTLILTLPSDWDGPFVSVLPVGVAIIYVLFGGFFGISGILLLCNM